MEDNLLTFNGIDGSNGDYILRDISSGDIASIARGMPLDRAERQDLKIRRFLDKSAVDHYGLKEGLDPTDLSQAGWGVIFPAGLQANEREALKEALHPLLDHRRALAAQSQERYYKECLGEDGYRQGESKQAFLERFGRGAGPADPEKMPYYLLIVGDPEYIPYTFQYQLDVQYAVGRIYFEDLEDYYRYANSVVAAEKSKLALPRRATFFGAANPGDRATTLSAEHLVKPLAALFSGEQPGWEIQTLLSEQAHKRNLADILGGDATPAMLFTATHGMSFPYGDARQFPHQGALLCQDWPGPAGHRGPIPQDWYFSAEDLAGDAGVFGLMAFLFACYGAGTPRVDNFHRLAFVDRKDIAPRAFLARLAQRMLAHPRGGALAVVGHVERAWGYSFYWEGVGQDLVTFESTLKRLAEGHPVGSALEHFNSRYAELASDLTSELDETTPDTQNEVKIASMWTSSNDARNYAILGDPAVRLMVSDGDQVDRVDRAAAIEIFTRTGEYAAAGELFAPAPASVSTPFPEGPASQISDAGLSSPATSLPAAGMAELEYGLLDNFKQAQAGLSDSLRIFVGKLGEFLGKALDDATSLEVATYMSENMAEVKFEDGHFQGARLRALTHIKIDGDTAVCLPEVDGEVDTALWKIHAEIVQQAQANRAELLKTAISAASGMVNMLKP